MWPQTHILRKGETMKKYIELKLVIDLFTTEDIVRTSGPDGENTLPWIDVTTTSPFEGTGSIN